MRWFKSLFDAIWREEVVPGDWKSQLLVPLHKKGSRTICDNYRGIALLSIPSKVFTKAILNRLKPRAEVLLRESQCGFRSGRGCADQLFSLRTLMEKAREFHRPLYICFVDLRKAYDTVNREALWSILQSSYRIPTKLLAVIQAVHADSRAAVRAYGRVSEGFDVSCGVRQGCVLAPTLFNLYFDVVIRMSLDSHHMQNKGVGVAYLHDAKLVGNRRKLQFETLITDLEYADDMALLADSWNDLEAMLTSLSTHCRNFGLSISCSKTKTMAVLPSSLYPQPAPIHLSPNQPPVESVTSFQYLGSIVQDDCGSDLEVNSRICKASQAFGSLSRILWYQKKIRTQTKLRVFTSVVLPTLLYGTECTVLLEPQVHRLQSFIMRCLRIILGISVWDMKRHTTIRKLAHQHRLSSLLSSRRLRFLGHIVRMPDFRLPKQLLVCALTGGARSVGGQKCRWNDLIQRDLVRFGIEQDWRELAQDRSAWRGIVEMSVNTINEEFEKKEDKKKDERKKKRQTHLATASAGLICDHPNCTFTASNRAGLVNHKRQIHGPRTTAQCDHCGKSFNTQGLRNHKRFCASRH